MLITNITRSLRPSCSVAPLLPVVLRLFLLLLKYIIRKYIIDNNNIKYYLLGYYVKYIICKAKIIPNYIYN